MLKMFFTKGEFKMGIRQMDSNKIIIWIISFCVIDQSLIFFPTHDTEKCFVMGHACSKSITIGIITIVYWSS